ncbi:MAG: hypothetical protein ACLUIQ_09840 [Dialister invisus]
MNGWKQERTSRAAGREVIVDVCETALWRAYQVSGSFKIPGLVPGTEFQLSAPIAVAICGVFGFKKYIIAGVLASLLSLALGTHTILNVTISMSFRLAVGAVWLLLGSSRLFYIFRTDRDNRGKGAMTHFWERILCHGGGGSAGHGVHGGYGLVRCGVLKRVRSIRKR